MWNGICIRATLSLKVRRVYIKRTMDEGVDRECGNGGVIEQYFHRHSELECIFNEPRMKE